MDFDVRKSDADALASWVNAFVGHMIEDLEGVAAGSSLGVLDGFAGAAADSSRATGMRYTPPYSVEAKR